MWPTAVLVARASWWFFTDEWAFRGGFLKRTNISTNPVGWVLGSYGISASYAFTDEVFANGYLRFGYAF